MTDSSVYPDDDQDQDSEATMTAPPEGRPDGVEAQPGGPHAQDADDQTGSEAPTS